MMRSRPYGPIAQNAYIVTDLDRAIDYWATTLNVGPFYKFTPSEFVDSTYRGRPQPIRLHAAIAYTGDLQIELITPLGPDPSVYRDWLDAGRDGVQHHCVFTDDMDAAEAHFVRKGAGKAQSMSLKDGSKISYFELESANMPMIEVAYLRPGLKQLFAKIKRAAVEWDGCNPTMMGGTGEANNE